MATGRDTIRFSRDIAPVIIDNCLECHGTGNNPGGNLRMSTFAELLQGGASGLELQPGVPAASLLLRKLKGLAGDRMPLKKPALSNEVIAKFEKWIAEGAHFDGNDPKETVETTAEVYRADHSTSDQLAADRLVRAKDLWHLAVPGQPPAVKETKNFTLLGDASPAVIDEVATVAEQQATRIAQMFKAPEDKPLVKGRITLFVCRQHYDYSEFAKMVESRELPPKRARSFPLQHDQFLWRDRAADRQQRLFARGPGGPADRRQLHRQHRAALARMVRRRRCRRDGAKARSHQCAAARLGANYSRHHRQHAEAGSVSQ